MYNVAIYISDAVIALLAIFNNKIAAMMVGRRETFVKLDKSQPERVGRKVYWIHCASLGEFEQGRPIIERIKARFPDSFVALSFFSPSGYKVRLNYELADVVFYLPSDTKNNMKRLVEKLKPDALFVVKYEFWNNMLSEAKNGGVKTYLFSALFQANMPFFKWYGDFFRSMLSCFTRIYVQDQQSKQLLSGIGIENVSVAGDTRFDRVIENKINVEPLPIVSDFVKSSSNVLVCGSTWAGDLSILVPFILKSRDLKVIIAPHNIDNEDIHSLCAALIEKGVVRYSNASKCDNLDRPQVLVIDCIGILKSVYQYGTNAYIGGGFGAGIHNILEAAVWGLPIMFGPHYSRFKEAVDLVELGGANVVKSECELTCAYLSFTQNDMAKEIVANYVGSCKGASDLIMTDIFGGDNGK